MANIAVIYASVHHKNTKKLLDGIAKSCEMDLFDISQVDQKDFSHYQAVGFASGIYMAQFHKSLLNFLNGHPVLPQKTFILYTSGTASKKYAKRFCEHLTQLGLQILGIYRCKGHDTYGFWKWIGGIAKGHPNEVDIDKGVSFIRNTIIQGL